MKDVLHLTNYVIIGMIVVTTGKPNHTFQNYKINKIATPVGHSMHWNKLFSAFCSDESSCWSANDGRCYIPMSSRCDGRNDCRGNFDERNC